MVNNEQRLQELVKALKGHRVLVIKKSGARYSGNVWPHKTRKLILTNLAVHFKEGGTTCSGNRKNNVRHMLLSTIQDIIDMDGTC